MKLTEVDTLLYIQPGAPVPIVLSDEYKLTLLYYYNKLISEDITSEMPVERNSLEDKGIASLSFKNHIIYKFGYPNAEVLQSHPYYNLGLESYFIYELGESDWINKIETMNRLHPFHNPIRFKLYRHFIITFEDSTFECIAQGLELNFSQNITMKDALKSLSESFIRQ